MVFVGKSEKRRIAANWAWSKCVLSRGVRKLMRKLSCDYIPSQVPSMLQRKWRTWGNRRAETRVPCLSSSDFFFSHCKLKSGRRSFLTGTVPEFERVLPRYSIPSHEERVLRASLPFFFSLIPELEEILPNECPARTRLFRFCQLTGTLVRD